MYLITTPWWLRIFYPSLIWSVSTKEKIIYLTFDDGPHTEATPFVLNELKKYHAKATFFCIGKNVEQYPDIYERILSEGHAVGNHTYNHFNGWKTNDGAYLSDVGKASAIIPSILFRPPYGRIKKLQIAKLQQHYKIIMWSVLSSDFDTTISPSKCLKNVIENTKQGSIIVFHDSAKAMERLQYALPETLKFFTNQGYQFKSLNG